MEQQKHYGLFTTIAMIVGIVIGSGIFFKADNILVATNGSIGLGILVFSIAAISIIFGCLTISNLAALTDEPGGVAAYVEQFIGRKAAGAFGWFQTFIYFPTITVIVSWAVGIFLADLFHLGAGLEMQILLGLGWFAICYAFNILSAKLGGIFQNVAAVAKLLPLICVGVLGLIWGDPVGAVMHTGAVVAKSGSSLGWVAAIGPIAFSFDGWIVSTTIAFEVKDAKKNLPRALVIAPLFILSIYLLYFVGISSYVGPDKILELGDGSVALAAQNMFGSLGAKGIMIFVVISVMGTVNGVILGFIRLPYSLALKRMLPGSKWLSKVHSGTNMPVNSGIFSIIICLIWWVVHYFTMKYDILHNSDISEISISMSYLLYIALYFQVFRLWQKGQVKGIWHGVVFPCLAAIGSVFILSGGLQNPNFLIYALVCLVVLVVGYIYVQKADNRKFETKNHVKVN